jgi:hypothetical protein
MAEAQAAARTVGPAVVTSEVRGAEDIAPAFDALKGRADALYVCGSPLLTTNRIRINTLALAVRLPTMRQCPIRSSVNPAVQILEVLNDEASVRGPHQGHQSTRTAPTGRTHDCK